VFAAAMLWHAGAAPSPASGIELPEPGDVSREPFDADAQQRKLDAIARGSGRSVEGLAGELRDRNPVIAAAAFQALAIRGDPEAARTLTDALREGSVATRLLIVRSAGRHDAARKYLYYALRDPDETVRRIAADVLFRSESHVMPEDH
jgi:HEAT repeat protein